MSPGGSILWDVFGRNEEGEMQCFGVGGTKKAEVNGLRLLTFYLARRTTSFRGPSHRSEPEHLESFSAIWQR